MNSVLVPLIKAAHSLIHSRWLFWIMLALPALAYIDDFLWPSRYVPEMLHRSGVLSVQLLVATLAVTPITLMLKPYSWGRGVSRWLLVRRKYLGLASAGYALIHTLLYLRSILWDFQLAWLEAFDWHFLTGWIAMFLFVVIASISNRRGVRFLGRYWKRIQRLAYPVAVFSFLHWLLLDAFPDAAMEWIIPLVFAKLLHILLRLKERVAKPIAEGE